MDDSLSLKNIALVTIGNIILAIGIAFLVFPNSIVTGGVSGIATILFSEQDGNARMMFIYCVQFLLFIVGWIFLGKKFALKTLVSTLVYPLVLTFIKPIGSQMAPEICHGNQLLASIYAGVILGVGVGIIMKAGGSTGGMDIIPLIVNKYTKIPVNKLVFITDGLTVCLGIAIRGFYAALVGLISVFLCSTLVNKMLTIGMEQAKSMMIISREYEAIRDALAKHIQRGATLIDAKGGYTKEQREILMVVLSKRQFNEASEIIHSIDPSAFVIVQDVNEVQGEGFSYNI